MIDLKELRGATASAKLISDSVAKPLANSRAFTEFDGMTASARLACNSVSKTLSKCRFPTKLDGATASAKLISDSMAETLAKSQLPQLQLENLAASARLVSKALGPFDESLATAKLGRQLADQQRVLDAMMPLPTTQFELLHIPPNPIHKTNERLANIEEGFDRMEAIAVDGARIATSLQTTALNFLVKFEKAASDNNRTAQRVIWIGSIAALFAIAMPLTQIVYTEFWRVPADAAAMQNAVVQVKEEVAGLKQAQRLVAEKISKALPRSNRDFTILPFD